MTTPQGATIAAMCAACVAQGTVYVGGAVVTLRVMAARAAARRRTDDDTPGPEDASLQESSRS